MNIGRKVPVFDNEGAGGGGGDDRVSALEARIGQLTSAVTGLVQHTATKEVQSQQQNEIRSFERLVSEADTKLAEATRKLSAAHEAGDAAAIAAATAAVSVAASQKTAAEIQMQSVKQRIEAEAKKPPEQKSTAQQPQQRVDDTNLKAWRKKHESWYGVDPELTREALDISREITKESILEVGSQQYFNAIDARLRAKFPDKIASSVPPGSQTQTQRGSTVPKNEDAGTARIPSSVAEGFRRMGIDVDNPEVAKSMVKAREIAVAKGFLPKEPETGRILTR